jgi:hypothetical protein
LFGRDNFKGLFDSERERGVFVYLYESFLHGNEKFTDDENDLEYFINERVKVKFGNRVKV